MSKEPDKQIDSFFFIFGLIKNGDLEKIVNEIVQKKNCTFEEASFEAVHTGLTNLFQNKFKDINLMAKI